jgi:PAT family beta-lactamase induction signal transducer AmpG
VPEATIAAMTAVMISSGFWAFLFSPVLDVRFSRRSYAAATAALAAALLVLALLNLDHLALVEGALLIGYFLANLYQSALGGWLASITAAELNWKLVWLAVNNATLLVKLSTKRPADQAPWARPTRALARL